MACKWHMQCGGYGREYHLGFRPGTLSTGYRVAPENDVLRSLQARDIGYLLSKTTYQCAKDVLH